MVVDQIIESLNTHTRRQPLTDATNRANNQHLNIRQPRGKQEKLASKRTPLRENPVTPAGDSVNRYSRPLLLPGLQAEFNWNPTMSAASIVLGKGKRKTHIGPWQLGKTLGKGSTSRVRLAKHSITGQKAAVKIVSKKSATMIQSESIVAMDRNAGNLTTSEVRQIPFGIEREVIIMKLIEHPNVISLYDVWENRGELYLVLEYVDGGELFDYISSNGPLPEEEAVRLFRQIIAAISYCHRYNICHRDLKPENILLDSKYNIKLADFGMAVLQLSGHLLNTSCGSPHYAAPEIVNGRRYHGDMADTWSCGIILFALLAGSLPFDGGDIAGTLRLVRRGEYTMPAWFSPEAADLIQRILQKQPEDRISIQDIWMHPLLKKYEKLHKSFCDHYVGPQPPLSTADCGQPLLGLQDIDLDILQNLQKLWHGVRREELIERLLDTKFNHERVFYNALMRFKEEQLENYQGNPLGYSTSDYHHISRPEARAVIQRSQSSNRVRHSRMYSRPSLSEIKFPPEIESDEDSPLATTTSAVYMNKGEDHLPSSTFSILNNRSIRGGSIRSLHSKLSHASSCRRINSATYIRSASYRRNVSFRHLPHPRSHLSAKAKGMKVQVLEPEDHQSIGSLKSAINDNGELSTGDSPVLPPQSIAIRGGGATMDKDKLGVRKTRDSSFVWKDAARRVSHELSQICEEAFNGTSSSTACTKDSCETAETSVTHISSISSGDSQHSSTMKQLRGSPSSGFTHLTESRRKLIEHSTKAGADDISAHLSGVISHLDRLIEQDISVKNGSDYSNQHVRFLPDPFTTLSEPDHLPVIAEEPPTSNSSANLLDLKQAAATTSFLQSSWSSSPAFQNINVQSTIRVVPRSSPGKLASPTACHNNCISPLKDYGTGLELDEHPLKQSSTGNGYPSNECYPSCRSHHFRSSLGLDRVEETPRPRRQNSTKNPDNKRWSWFKRKQQVDENIAPESLKGDSVRPRTARVVVREVSPPDELEHLGSRPSTDEPRESLFRRLMKKIPKKDGNQVSARPPEESAPAIKPSTGPPETVKSKILKRPHNYHANAIGRNQNWLARFFQIKPATRVLALNSTKLKARRDIYKKLLEWKQYGIEELYLDKADDFIRARVGENNFLNVRPVEFSAAFYTVLEQGRHANLSIVRFKQERGAASTFNEVVNALCVMLQGRNMLVEDPVRAKDMIGILDAFR